MSVKFKWITILFCICGFTYLGTYYLPVFFTFNKQKYDTAIQTSCIIESCKIRDVLEYATDEQTIVVFDLDNTLVHPGQELGSDQWFSYMFKEKLASGMSRPDVLTFILPLYYEIYDHIPLYPVEPEGPAILSTLQKKGIKTVALTTKSLPLVARTQIQLKDAGFSFAPKGPFNCELTVQLEKPALLSHGIIFCNDNNKGPTLLKTLNTLNCIPKKIVFVDDKLSNLLDVEKDCLLNKIQFIGIRYGKLDSVVAQFDPARAEQQYAALFGKDYSGHQAHV